MGRVKYCPECAKEGKTGVVDMPIPGYNLYYYDYVMECGKHHVPLQSIEIEGKDFSTLCKISKDMDFINAMIDLRKTDIIEFESKMTQFRAQVEQQKNKNVPHCPTCGSTNIRKISAASKMAGGLMFGLFSKTARSQFECLNCKCKW